MSPGVSILPRVEKVEYETIIKDCPPYLCASRCPHYNRDPCPGCEMRPVLFRDVEIVENGGED